MQLASLAAIEKKGSEDVRVVYDGTHGVLTNFGIRVRDHVRNPTAVDVKAWLAEQAQAPSTRFSVAYDVADAHRQVPMLEEDWGLLACQVEGTAAETNRRMVEDDTEAEKRGPGDAPRVKLRARKAEYTPEQLDEEVWVNMVGTFGISSAGYWWGRCGALLLRLTYYLTPAVLAIWVLLYADDGLSTAQGPWFDRAIFFHLYVLEVLGTPFKWRKIRGGIQTEWIGYWVDFARFELGISEARTQWCIRWATDKSRERLVSLQEMREGLGRLCFVAGPLEHLRPLLGPLYAWSCRGPKFARRRLPVVLRLILDFLALQLGESHMGGCREPAKNHGELFRLDAKAEGNEVAVGGWVSKGGQTTKEAKWFAVRLTPRNAPWAFARGEPFRLIASLELLGMLLGTMLLAPAEDFERGAESTGLVTIGCLTDNQGNAFLLDRLVTTKYPLALILIELAWQCAQRRVALRADWVPRMQNEEADDLTNGKFEKFCPGNRIPVELEKLEFGILHKLLEAGEEYHKEIEEAKATAKAERIAGKNRVVQRKKRLKGESLKDTDPW